MRRALWLLSALLVLAGGAASAQVSGAPVGPKTGPLSRLDGGLQQAYAAHVRGETARIRGGVVGDGYVAVDVAAADGDGAALLGRLRGLGLEDGVALKGLVSGRIPISALGALADLDGVRTAQAVRGVTHSARAGRGGAAASPVFVGAVTGEASRALRVAEARERLDVDGSGIRMGILSDSYNACARLAADSDPDNNCETTAQEDVASGDLPSGINVLRELPAPTGGNDERGTDEGRAMMQLAYDVAPGVDFSFYTAFLGQAAFAQGILDLAADGSDVIVDDVLLFAEPFFQDGLIAQAVTRVVDEGVVYASSAGNQADQAYQSPFVDSQVSSNFDFVDANGNIVTDENGLPVRLVSQLHDFDSGTTRDAFQDVTLGSGESVTIVFQYAEPSRTASGGTSQDPGATSDYDIYLVDRPSRSATAVAYGLGNNNINAERGTGEPVEVLQYTNDGPETTLYLAIGLFSGDPRFFKYIDFDGQATFEYAQSGNSTSVAHNNAANALNVGASAWFNTPAFNNLPNAIVNSFSSYGGSEVFFDSAGNRLDEPEDRQKPDVVGSDGDNNTFFGLDTPADDDTNPNFFGTSAAAPNVGAVAALMLDAAGGPRSLTPSLVYAILEDTAADITPFQLTTGTANEDTNAGYDTRSGFGFVQGDRALDLASRATPAETAPPAAAFAIRDLGPNPAHSSLAFTVTADAPGDLTVEVFDVLGRRALTVYVGPAQVGAPLALTASVDALPAGAYLVRARLGGRTVSYPIIVVR